MIWVNIGIGLYLSVIDVLANDIPPKLVGTCVSDSDCQNYNAKYIPQIEKDPVSHGGAYLCYNSQCRWTVASGKFLDLDFETHLRL